jgi:hypothetical protein
LCDSLSHMNVFTMVGELQFEARVCFMSAAHVVSSKGTSGESTIAKRARHYKGHGFLVMRQFVTKRYLPLRSGSKLR